MAEHSAWNSVSVKDAHDRKPLIGVHTENQEVEVITLEINPKRRLSRVISDTKMKAIIQEHQDLESLEVTELEPKLNEITYVKSPVESVDTSRQYGDSLSYPCSLKRSFLVPGKLVLMDQQVTFHSAKMRRSIEIPYSDIISLNNSFTALIVPTSMQIITAAKIYEFANISQPDLVIAEISKHLPTAKEPEIEPFEEIFELPPIINEEIISEPEPEMQIEISDIKIDPLLPEEDDNIPLFHRTLEHAQQVKTQLDEELSTVIRVSDDDSVIQAYFCSMKSEQLFHYGKLYVTQRYICFRAESGLVYQLEMENIESIVPTTFAIVLPHGMSIFTKSPAQEVVFAQLHNRDQVVADLLQVRTQASTEECLCNPKPLEILSRILSSESGSQLGNTSQLLQTSVCTVVKDTVPYVGYMFITAYAIFIYYRRACLESDIVIPLSPSVHISQPRLDTPTLHISTQTFSLDVTLHNHFTQALSILSTFNTISTHESQKNESSFCIGEYLLNTNVISKNTEHKWDRATYTFSSKDITAAIAVECFPSIIPFGNSHCELDTIRLYAEKQLRQSPKDVICHSKSMETTALKGDWIVWLARNTREQACVICRQKFLPPDELQYNDIVFTFTFNYGQCDLEFIERTIDSIEPKYPSKIEKDRIAYDNNTLLFGYERYERDRMLTRVQPSIVPLAKEFVSMFSEVSLSLSSITTVIDKVNEFCMNVDQSARASVYLSWFLQYSLPEWSSLKITSESKETFLHVIEYLVHIRSRDQQEQHYTFQQALDTPSFTCNEQFLTLLLSSRYLQTFLSPHDYRKFIRVAMKNADTDELRVALCHQIRIADFFEAGENCIQMLHLHLRSLNELLAFEACQALINITYKNQAAKTILFQDNLFLTIRVAFQSNISNRLLGAMLQLIQNTVYCFSYQMIWSNEGLVVPLMSLIEEFYQAENIPLLSITISTIWRVTNETNRVELQTARLFEILVEILTNPLFESLKEKTIGFLICLCNNSELSDVLHDECANKMLSCLCDIISYSNNTRLIRNSLLLYGCVDTGLLHESLGAKILCLAHFGEPTLAEPATWLLQRTRTDNVLAN